MSKEVESKPASNPEKPQGVSIVFPDHLKKGQFANSVFISHTAEEFVLDFLAVAPNAGSIVSRIFMTPSHTKRLVKALTENLKKYEDVNGPISEAIGPKH